VKIGSCAVAAGLILAACATSPAQNTTSQSARAGQGSSTAPVNVPVVTPVRCGIDNGGFGAPVRHFGNETPWSEDPFRNPCWPN